MEEYIAITPVPLRKWGIYGGRRRKTKNEQTSYSRLHRMTIWPYRRWKTLQVYFPFTSRHEVLRVNILSSLKRIQIDLLQRNSLPKKGVKNQFHTSAMVLHSAHAVQLTVNTLQLFFTLQHIKEEGEPVCWTRWKSKAHCISQVHPAWQINPRCFF